MSLNAAFFAASSGLQLTSRGTKVVADNIANAATEGYVTRRLTQSATVLGGQGVGVTDTGIERHIPQILLDDLRSTNAQSARADVISNFWRNMEQTIGQAGTPGALPTQFLELETALVQASTTPESSAALIGVAQAAQDVAKSFNQIAGYLATETERSNRALLFEVDNLNMMLEKVSHLNSDIVRLSVTQGDVSSTVEQRQALIDQIGRIVPIKEIPRELGRSTLVAADGSVILDREAARFKVFIPSDGPAQVSLNGRALKNDSALLANGQIAGLLEIRDVHIPTKQADFDRLAADLIQRFSGPQADPTLAPGQPGLFQDREDPSSLQPTKLLAARLGVSASIDPARPSDLWRLRDGLEATRPGPVGSRDVLSSLLTQLRKAEPVGDNFAPSYSAFGHVSNVAAEVATRRLHSEAVETQATARVKGLSERALSFGVNSDLEMQRLLMLERHYAANAKVIAAVDNMLQTLLEI